MFFSKHAQKNFSPQVFLLCKCFSKSSVVLKTIFTKIFNNEEEFRTFATKSYCDVTELDRVDNALIVKNIVTGGFVPNKTLVTAQTNIFLALNKSLAKCGSDPIKCYLFTAARLLVGDEAEMPYSFTNIKAFLSHYYAASKCAKITHDNPADDLFSLYNRVFRGDKVFVYINFARETLTAAILATRRLEEVYDQYNLDTIVNFNGLSYANLEFFCAMENRFGSVLDILMSDKSEDEAQVNDYKSKLETVSDCGAKYIQEYINQTVKYETYDHKKHTGYTVDNNFKGDHGITPAAYCGQISKQILKTDLFPNSISKCIKGTSVHHISNLCNSDKRTIMSKKSVKDLLRTKHDVPTNTAFVGTQTSRGFMFSRLLSPAAMDKTFITTPLINAIKSHVTHPSMVSYNRYSKELSVAPHLTINELINPKMTVFTVSLDLDSKELVKMFYRTSEAWKEREKVMKIMRETMEKMTPLKEFICCMYESRPDSADTDKVGLRVVYKFKRLVFKNTDVLRRFIRAFKFFLTRRDPVLGNAIDDGMYTSGGGKMLRLPCMWKIKNGKPSRQLIGVMDKKSMSFLPSYGLVHHKHTYLAENKRVEVMTDIGDIKSLIKTPQDAEISLIKSKTNRKRKAAAPPSQILHHLTDIIEDSLMPAIHSRGGGIKDDKLTGVERRYVGYRDQYTLTPTIHWCTVKKHADPKGNPCRYFVSLNGTSFSVGMMCFACGFDPNIYEGDLPL